MTSRKKPGLVFWATVGVVVALPLLVASFGPAVWLVSRGAGDDSLLRLYWPLGAAAYGSSMPVFRALCWYGSVGLPTNKGVKWQLDATGEMATWLPN
jgi:hypothetical protein